MKRTILLLLCFVTLAAIGQVYKRIGKLERINKSLYVSTNKEKFPLNKNVVTVKLKPQTRAKIIQQKNCLRVNKLGYADLQVPKGVDFTSYIDSLDKSGDFEVVEYNSYGTYCSTADDSNVNRQWYLNSINISTAWNTTMGNGMVKVAVIDSGTDWTHPDLGLGSDGYKNVEEELGWNYLTGTSNVITTNKHGTIVTGIIGAKTNNRLGIAGIAGGNHQKGISIIPFCLGVDSPNNAFLDDAIIDATDKGAKIIQLSLNAQESHAINAAIDYANSKGVLIVCATGNAGRNSISYPSSHPKILSVGAINEQEKRSIFSNYGQGLDIVAPGENIYSTSIGGTYAIDSGTSFAAPQVSAVAALILSVRPDLNGQQVRGIIEQTARKLSNYQFMDTIGRNSGTWNAEVGYGTLDAAAAINAAVTNLTEWKLEGPSSICDDTTYRLEGLPQDATVTWNVHPNLQIISQTNERIVVRTKNLNTTLINGWVEAKITKPSEATLIKKQIVLWEPGVNQTELIGGHLGWDGGEVSLPSEIFNSGAYGFRWRVDAWNFSYTGNNTIVFVDPQGMDCNCNSTYVTVDFYTPCGQFVSFYKQFTWEERNMFSFSIRQAANQIIVEMQDNKLNRIIPTLKAKSSTPIEIVLSDLKGVLKHYTTNQNIFQIPLVGLDKGIYFIRVTKNGQSAVKKFIKY